LSLHPFIKMHGLGNDFVIIDGRDNNFLPDVSFCQHVADRHRGVGYDQLIILGKPKNSSADLFMHMFNADGTKAGACGNATRCVARLLFEEKKETEGVIETISGLLPVWEEENDLISVNFGPPHLAWDEIPLGQESDTLNIDLGCHSLPPACCVNMGNPHAVFFIPDVTAIILDEIGPKIENHPLFPDRTNVEFAQILDAGNIRMRVWERGTGITQACGSGACATLVAAVQRHLCARKAKIHLDGGTLKVSWREKDEHVILSGSTALSFRGTLDYNL